MIDRVSTHQDALIGLCRRFGVARLEVFGSAACGAFDPLTSDIDFLVEFSPGPPGGYFDAYFGLLEALQNLFGCAVDLVMTSAIRNRYFLESANKTRTLVYAA